MIIHSQHRRLSAAIGVLAAAGGALVAVHYYQGGLTLSHYDARGHLVVARRIVDSITPGWQQLGAVWLPLPHLLNALPVQVDAFYRTGASGVAISVASFALSAAAVTSIILSVTGSAWAAVAGAAILALNPNMLYLQATPMTEPLLLGLTTLAVALLLRWETRLQGGLEAGTTPVNPDADRLARRDAALRRADLPTHGLHQPREPWPAEPRPPRRWQVRLLAPASLAGFAFALASLTRYEAWPVTAFALAAAVWVRWRCGDAWQDALRRVAPIAIPGAAAIGAFLLFSRIVIGDWFASGFFVPENVAIDDPVASLSQIIWGTRALSGDVLTTVAAIGLGWLVILAVVDKQRATGVIALSLVATAALPWWAFVQGHPYRIRYMVPLIAAEAVGAGVIVGVLLGRARALGMLGATALVAFVAFERPPLDARAAMITEAQWDRPNVSARRQVTECLRAGYQGDTIMASMGSLGHYMQELAAAGFAVRDFLHEGNGDIWLRALEAPRPFVGWILIEEKSEGGDMLARLARENPRFLDGFSRVCEASGIALYQRQNRMLNVAR